MRVEKKTMKRLLALVMIWGLIAGLSSADERLTGTTIGSQWSVDYSNGGASNTVNTIRDALDGNLDTYFASWDRSKTWVGLDLGTPHVITSVRWSPRNDGLGPQRTVLGLFEGANDPNFLDAVPLYLIDQAVEIGRWGEASVNVSRGVRYVRYVGPNDARCNIAEVEFYGHEGEGDDSHFYQITNLPTVTIHTQDNVDPQDKVNDIVSHMAFIYQDGTLIQEETGSTRLRGNASITFPKKPYRIKLDSKSHLLKGSPLRSPAKAKKWTLINNYGDKTLMRNIVSFEVSRRMGVNYVPWCQPVDVIYNGEYKGCYQLCDQITVDKNRINIAEMETTDNQGEELTGGYLLELDGYASQEPSWFYSRYGNPITIKYPDEEKITTEQHQYIEQQWNLMESKMMSRNFADPEVGYRSRLDEMSLIRYFLAEEIVGNPDAFHSTYVTKDRGDKRFRVATVWDFDLAFDNDGRYFPNRNLGDFLSLSIGGAGNSRSMMRHLFADEAFTDSLTQVWDQARQQGGITEESLLAYIDSVAQELQQSQRLNFMRWPILNQRVHENPRAAGSYEGEVQWMREYVHERLPFLDALIYNTAPTDETVEIASADDFAALAARVNGGERALSARLMADIDLSESHPNLMINDFSGTFDGAGHSIRISLNDNADNTALFRILDGTVQDLTVEGNITSGGKFIGGIAGTTNSKAHILRCTSRLYVQSTVWGDGTHGGIVGVANTGTQIEDCLVASASSGSNTNCCGGVVGWANGTTYITNCLVVGEIGYGIEGSDLLCRNAQNVVARGNYIYTNNWSAANDNHATVTNRTDLKSGEICWQLNQDHLDQFVWHQTLKEDAYPVLDSSHASVYPLSRLNCDGTPIYAGMGYTNNERSYYRKDHILEDGVCTVCGACDESTMPRDERGYLVLSTDKQINWFAQLVSSGKVESKAVLGADIDLSSYPSLIIGGDKHFAGVFDGAGHTVTLDQVRYQDNAGLFGHLDGLVHDLTVRGNITTQNKFAGAIAGSLYGGAILRCQSYVDIHSTVWGDGTHGGLVGVVNSADNFAEITDCVFAGSIQSDGTNCCGGLVGWAGAPVIMSNCLMAGDMRVDASGSDMLCRNNTNLILENSYYVSDWTPESTPATAVSVTRDVMGSGELCHLLNLGQEDGSQVWYQTLDTDFHPVPDASHATVYKWNDGSYHNEPWVDGLEDHFAEQRTDGKLYDLQGRQLTRKPQHGVYIVNGRKIVQ